MQLRALFIFLLVPFFLLAQKNKKSEGYIFKDKYLVNITSVKNQYRTGTCWSFAATSFIESELLRLEKGEHDLSEMFFVRHAYQQKAEDYVRYHGYNNFSEGGQAHDVLNVVKKHGFVPEIEYTGLNYGEQKHIHTEMVAMLKGMLNGVVNNPRNRLTPSAWKKSISAVLDIYLGKLPENFAYLDTKLTAQELTKKLEFETNNYFEFTSYTDAPFYEQYVLKIPDNWSRDLYYNVPLEEFMQIIDNALMNGYSVCWDGDVSEKEFSHQNAIAIIPAQGEMSKKEEENLFKTILEEKEITQEFRQNTFNDYRTTDDHLMHLVGIAFDQKGNKYYKTKNSWGPKRNEYGGFLYMSESYLKLKTVAFLVHKDAIPAEIYDKLK